MKTSSIFDLVVGRSLNYGIGKNGSLPWHIPSDLKMVKKITTSSPIGNTLIMGRKTYESIINRTNGKPLPGRLNIVVSKQTTIKNPEFKQARSVDEALLLAQQLQPKGRIFIFGGQKIYQDTIYKCRYIYETLVNHQFQCDAFMPKHNFPTAFVSKTMRENNLTYDYRLYYNPALTQKPTTNEYSVEPHQEYQYIHLIKKIIEGGEGKNDRTKTGTKSIFGGMMRYDLKHTFPLLTHKKVFWRGVAEELLWFVKGSTNAKQLESKGINIWAGNSSKEYLNSIGIDRQAGDLGPVYGFQWRHWNAPYTNMHAQYSNQGFDQLKWIIQQIKKNPSSRRLILSAWNPSQLSEMALPPCHMMSQFYVTSDNRLSCIMYQRSCDTGLGVPFNIASYSLLTCLIAQVTGLGRGQFIHMGGDIHVYNDHIESLKNLEQLVPYPFPTLDIDPSIKNIDDFRFEHLKLNGYRSHKKIEMKMSV